MAAVADLFVKMPLSELTDGHISARSSVHETTIYRKGGTKDALFADVRRAGRIPPWIITGHRWHLAVEWSNWTEAYLGS